MDVFDDTYTGRVKACFDRDTHRRPYGFIQVYSSGLVGDVYFQQDQDNKFSEGDEVTFRIQPGHPKPVAWNIRLTSEEKNRLAFRPIEFDDDTPTGVF